MGLSKQEIGRLGGYAAGETQRFVRERKISDYNLNPNLCKHCNKPISYNKRLDNIYCSHSCSASSTNPRRKKFRNTDVFKKPRKSRNKQEFCLNCNKDISKQPAALKYCSFKCQYSYKRKDRITKGTATAKIIKSFLLENHGNICMDPDCVWDFEKRPIKVELEHKDGNSEHNTIENCMLICPNCHSLTATYKNRNAGNGRHKRRLRYAEGKSY